MSSNFVKFSRLRSSTDHTFWAKFAELKIDKFKLDEQSEISLWGSYNLQSTCTGNVNPLLLDCTSFNEDVETTTHNSGIVCQGVMVHTNTFEAFRKINPEQFIEHVGQTVLKDIKSGVALREPCRLGFFLIFAYSDLKKYKFHYWVAHPTPFTLPELIYSTVPKSVEEEFSVKQVEKLCISFLELPSKSKSFFTVVVSGKEDLRTDDLQFGLDAFKMSKMEDQQIYFAFYDPCTSTEPGWPLRNLICLLYWNLPDFDYCFGEGIRILSIRGNKGQNSLVFTLKLQEKKTMQQKKLIQEKMFNGRLVGWESNANGKMGPNIADLSSTMDPSKLSNRAVNLNLKLMKWQLVPNLDLEKISNLRCLLLGAGTLGCAVARGLIGWNVKTITFVDNSSVSYSNTVRQSLYTYQDAVERRFKADAARDALLRINPNIQANGVVLQIPMPGHVVGESLVSSTQDTVTRLEDLVREHDVVFLTLDSREARWLPTVMCAAMNKIAINAALGFDSYTVQRHGSRNSAKLSSPDLTLQNPSGSDLGCYFCNDVTQPGNSQTDRTLDKQCTVTRPGLSQVAAGLAVELLMAITQHPQGIEAVAMTMENRDTGLADSKRIGLLGGAPHTIRGNLFDYETRLTVTHRFPSCTACSIPLITEYRNRGFSFILDACNVPNYLEKLSGLEDILKRPGLDDLCYALDSMDDDSDDQQFVIP